MLSGRFSAMPPLFCRSGGLLSRLPVFAWPVGDGLPVDNHFGRMLNAEAHDDAVVLLRLLLHDGIGRGQGEEGALREVEGCGLLRIAVDELPQALRGGKPGGGGLVAQPVGVEDALAAFLAAEARLVCGGRTPSESLYQQPVSIEGVDAVVEQEKQGLHVVILDNLPLKSNGFRGEGGG